MLKSILKENNLYFIYFLFYLVFSAFVLINYEKGDFVILINKNHNPFFDFFFNFVTYLGDGLFVVPFIFYLLLFQNKTKGFLVGISVLLTFIIIQFLKRVVFNGEPRPSIYLEGKETLYFVPGIEIHKFNSFPSGHAGQAFAISLILSLVSKNKKLSIIYFLLAFLVSISRVYLAQHFFIDTFAASLIATFVGLLVYIYFSRKTSFLSDEKYNKGFLT